MGFGSDSMFDYELYWWAMPLIVVCDHFLPDQLILVLSLSAFCFLFLWPYDSYLYAPRLGIDFYIEL